MQGQAGQAAHVCGHWGGITTLNVTSWQKLAPGLDVTAWGERTHLNGSVHGVETKIHLGTGCLEGVNSVGKDWFSAGKLVLVADYAGEGCLLMKSDPAMSTLLPKLPRPAD